MFREAALLDDSADGGKEEEPRRMGVIKAGHRVREKKEGGTGEGPPETKQNKKGGRECKCG